MQPEPGAIWAASSAEHPRLYGALLDNQLDARAEASRNCKKRRRVNGLAGVLALVLPWGLFIAVLGTVSFYFHYAAPLPTNLAVGLVLVLCGASTWSAIGAWRDGLEDRHFRLYMGFALTLACCFGYVYGSITFWQFMQPSYHVDHLATYSNVDPSSRRLWSGEDMPVHGKRYQDAGIVYFSHETILDRSRSGSFKDGDLYCVAPIVNPRCEKNCGYDFWAVGINCCSEFAADFRCGDYNSTHARAGVRQVVDTWRPFFRLAVMQVEGSHEMVSRHPIFFHWVDEPKVEVLSWKKSGYRGFIMAMVIFFFSNALGLVLYLQLGRK